MNVFEYVGTDLEHISFDNDEIDIIEIINKINIEKISYNELSYIILNSCLYNYDKVLFTMKKKYEEEYKSYVEKNKDIMNLFGKKINNKEILHLI